jgi:predicted PurR-regulated permease PerM
MTWIAVLAVAITCCAVLFLVFANYLVTINKNLSLANERLTTMESNETQLLSEIQALHRTMIANISQTKTAPNEPTPPTPAPTTPASPSAPTDPQPGPPPVTH